MTVMNLKKLRKEKNLTQQELARMAAVSICTLSNHETGKDNPSITALEKYAGALRCSIPDIVETKTCPECERALPLNYFEDRKENKLLNCRDCTKQTEGEKKGKKVNKTNKITIQPTEEQTQNRDFTEGEKIAYEIGVGIGKRKGWDYKRIVQELAQDHHRKKEFIKGVLQIMGIFDGPIVDCPRCGTEVKLIDGFNICMRCALPIGENDIVETKNDENENKGR